MKKRFLVYVLSAVLMGIAIVKTEAYAATPSKKSVRYTASGHRYYRHYRSSYRTGHHLASTTSVPTPMGDKVSTTALPGHVEVNSLVTPLQDVGIPIKSEHQFVSLLSRKDYSWVSEMTSRHATQVAEAITAFITRYRPAKSTSIMLIPAVQRDNPIGSLLTSRLSDLGYTMVSPDAHWVTTTRIRYVVDENDGGILVRLQMDDLDAARWYVLDNNRQNMIAASPFTVRRVTD